MKALVYYGNKDVRVEDVDQPQVKDELVKLKIDYFHFNLSKFYLQINSLQLEISKK